ncbi:hypothetical protein NQD34_013658 [Periophthalmus magnuspinnatus]|nr:hypothetical protein NQD34_013658 [Periophthalmus magnuspinnatus]
MFFVRGTFIPNNTAPDGSITRTLKRLQMFSDTMHSHSGVNNPLDEWFSKMFGSWKQVAMSMATTLVMVVALFVFGGCCCIPLIRSLIERVIQRAVGGQLKGQYTMLREEEVKPTLPVLAPRYEF